MQKTTSSFEQQIHLTNLEMGYLMEIVVIVQYNIIDKKDTVHQV